MAFVVGGCFLFALVTGGIVWALCLLSDADGEGRERELAAECSDICADVGESGRLYDGACYCQNGDEIHRLGASE